MLRTKRPSDAKKAKTVIRELVSYADDIAPDQQVRSHLRAATKHGSRAAARVQKGLEAPAVATCLVSDKRRRRELRRMLHDLEKAGDRARRRRRHRLRNRMLVVVGGAGAAIAISSRARRWLGQRTAEPATP